MPFYRCSVVLYVFTHVHILLTITIQLAKMPALSHYFENLDNVPPLGIAIVAAALVVGYLCFEPENHADIST